MFLELTDQSLCSWECGLWHLPAGAFFHFCIADTSKAAGPCCINLRSELDNANNINTKALRIKTSPVQLSFVKTDAGPHRFVEQIPIFSRLAIVNPPTPDKFAFLFK